MTAHLGHLQCTERLLKMLQQKNVALSFSVEWQKYQCPRLALSTKGGFPQRLVDLNRLFVGEKNRN